MIVILACVSNKACACFWIETMPGFCFSFFCKCKGGGVKFQYVFFFFFLLRGERSERAATLTGFKKKTRGLERMFFKFAVISLVSV